GTTVDGVISGQPKNRSKQNIPSAKYGTSGSNLISAMQRNYVCKIVNGKISKSVKLIKNNKIKYNFIFINVQIILTSIKYIKITNDKKDIYIKKNKYINISMITL